MNLFEPRFKISGEFILNEEVFKNHNTFLLKSKIKYQLGQYGSSILKLIHHYNKLLLNQNNLNIEDMVNILENFIQDHLISKLRDFKCKIS